MNDDSAQRLENLITLLENAADGRLQHFQPLAGSDVLSRLEQATAKFFGRVQNMNAESGEAMNTLANTNVQLFLWSEALEKINAADSLFHRGGELKDFYQAIVRCAREMTRARYGALGLYDEDGTLQTFITDGVDEQTFTKIGRYPQGRGLLKALLSETRPMIINNISADPRACGFPDGHPLMTCLITAPLMAGKQVKGMIYLANKESGEFFESQSDQHIDTVFTEEDEHMLGLFTDYLLRALERTELVLELEQMVEQLNAAQSQLLQSEKMASIGQLAAGVAHEINNPIGFVNSNLNTLSDYIEDLFALIQAYEELRPDQTEPGALSLQMLEIKKRFDLDFLKQDVPDLLRESRDGLDRVKRIINDLKEFSHVHEAEWQKADLHQGLDSTLNVVWNEIKYKAELIKNYGEIPEIECLPSQLNQVFLNLLVNAAQAIKERGTITISTGISGDQVWITIADSGQGIAPEHLAHIFEPFFTTKPVGKGTGLGLSLSYNIVQKHHGHIQVTSQVGQGTTFRITLPFIQPVE